jgi:hypothetical protein
MRKKVVCKSGMFCKFYPKQYCICNKTKVTRVVRNEDNHDLREEGRGAKWYLTTVAQIGTVLCTAMSGRRGRCYRLRGCWKQLIGGPVKKMCEALACWLLWTTWMQNSGTKEHCKHCEISILLWDACRVAYGVTASVVSRMVKQIVNLLWILVQNYVKWNNAPDTHVIRGLTYE